MKEIIDYAIVPSGFLMCCNKECAKADECLRQLIEQSVSAEVEYWNIVSPKYLATLSGDCPYYRSAEKIRYAKGFINMLEDMPLKQMKVVVERLMHFFGRTAYYRFRKGERLLSPDEQQQVLSILADCGITQPPAFDEYTEEYDWQWLNHY